MTNGSSNRTQNASTGPSIQGIWRLGETIYRSATAELSLAQPADASGSRRWDYVIKRAVDTGSGLEGRRQILQSIAATARIVHPNLVAVLDASTTAASPYLVMPRLEGKTMQWYLESETWKPLPVALWLVRQVAQALEALHAGGWIHGDIKPQNAIVGLRGHVTLVDLGLATRIHTVSQHQFRGTPAYSAPESLSGEMAAMPGMDVFSLGRVLWQWMIRTERVKQSLLEPVADLVEAMVSEDPEDRPTASCLAKQLLRLEIETLGRHIGPKQRRKAA